MDFAEMMFYAEAEGLLPTRAGTINAIIKDIKDDPRATIDQDDFEEILSYHNLTLSDLTRREFDYIMASTR